MKFNFKIQQYQTDAVSNTVKVFAGQPSHKETVYRRDLGNTEGKIVYETEYTGYRNSDIELDKDKVLENIRAIQNNEDIIQSEKLVNTSGLGFCSLDVEMETGTGKTYVYIKTMFELYKQYGWSKFIVVVPSIAIREGVNKSFTMLEDHFMEQYGHKARFFIYNSSNLQQLDSFSSDGGINVMIINCQAFNRSLKEGAKNKESQIIYSKRDAFGSRRPIDVIAANRPIIIMDEPQKMEGKATQAALKNFKPLFLLNYSATHRTQHNLIYALDAYDAFKKRLVKKIQVKGFDVKNLKGSSQYLYIDNIILSTTEAPKVKIELEVSLSSGIKKKSFIFDTGDKLIAKSGLKEYEGFDITEINPYNNTVSFLNGITIKKGEVYGDANEENLQRVQIRETIVSHFEKECELFEKGIKTLSLFFIDEVANYKSYDEEGDVVHGRLWNIFEEEYTNILNEKLSLFPSDYQNYLKKFTVDQIHNGYFSIDKKGHAINSSTSRGQDTSDDISAYDLILKNKERLLDFNEPTRFIFSHSALREGWDNPNVFQICTLRHANSSTAKRQEVGRGLRICVDKNGNRMDADVLGDDVQELNKLTVIANESYSSFVDALQKETREVLRERPTKADASFFKGKTIDISGEKHIITDKEAELINSYLYANDYIDEQDKITQAYKDAVNDGTVVPLPKKIESLNDGVQLLIQSIFDESIDLEGMVENADAVKTPENVLNDNFNKKEFQELWKNINHKYAYTVHYDSDELVKKAINSIESNLVVTQLQYVITTGNQQAVDEFGIAKTATKSLSSESTSTVEYDLVGEIAKGANLTRKTVVKILKGISFQKFNCFKNNPEEFIRKVIQLIKEQKATMIVESISYNQISGEYEASIFTETKRADFDKAYKAEKHITDYVFTDGLAEKSTERKFAEALDTAAEVCVYAKLPRSFQIPTPVGNYAPDWAIAFHKGTVKHIFFIAETKGSMETMELREIERAKIQCADKLFNNISTSNVRYSRVTSYDKLLEAIENLM